MFGVVPNMPSLFNSSILVVARARHLTRIALPKPARVRFGQLTYLQQRLIIALEPTRATALVLGPRNDNWATEVILQHKSPSAGYDVQKKDLKEVRSILRKHEKELHAAPNGSSDSQWKVKIIESDGTEHTVISPSPSSLGTLALKGS